MLQVGDATVLEKRAIWLCVSCETCVTRCPREIDLPRVMDALRQVAYERANEQPVVVGELLRRALKQTLAGLKEGLQMGSPHAQRVFSATFLENIRRFGRSFETGLIGSVNLNVGSLLGNVDKGPEMLMKGKMRMLPDKVCNVARIQEIFAKIEELEGKKI
jgi:heterodisulfide reductase subunit C